MFVDVCFKFSLYLENKKKGKSSKTLNNSIDAPVIFDSLKKICICPYHYQTLSFTLKPT